MRGATHECLHIFSGGGVSIHAPHAGRDTQYVTLISSPGCFNPRAPCGARRPSHNLLKRSCGFNPRAPCGARRGSGDALVAMAEFQSTRPMRGATVSLMSVHLLMIVSIHAPMRGATSSGHPSPYPCRCFNPRAPCGARLIPSTVLNQIVEFQSTRPMRGATPIGQDQLIPGVFQSTRPMRGATFGFSLDAGFTGVSIHAPHAGRDADQGIAHRKAVVSIHAPHAGRDFRS